MVKVVIISDTHCQHDRFAISECDLFIHCGDFTHRGKHEEIKRFTDWLEGLTQCKEKVVIAGNHELGLDEKLVKPIRTEKKRDIERLKSVCHYLHNEMITLYGLNIYGSPMTPEIDYNPWAFNYNPHLDIWSDMIPDNANIDILVTHGPPEGYGDLWEYVHHLGCPFLRTCVERVKPKYHFFGHVHAGRQKKSNNKHTTFINASVLDDNHKIICDPVVLEI